MFTKKIMEYIGDISQIGGIKRYCHLSGKAKGVEAFDINNGNGLLFTVLVDRGLDIANLSYKGLPMSFISRTGIVSPCYYNERGLEWLRSFTGGFLTTCGLTQVGEPCTFEGNEYGLHGHYANLPAEITRNDADWQDDRYVMEISGKIRQAKHQSENLVLKRTIKTVMGEDSIIIEDCIRNEGGRKEPFMILYHMNFGYPFLNPNSEIILPVKSTQGWDDFSKNHLGSFLEITEPLTDAPNYTYLHELHADANGRTGYMIVDNMKDPSIGISVKFNKAALPFLGQWKYFHKKDYIMALEPCNNQINGVEYECQRGTLRYLEPDEEVKICLEVTFLNSAVKIQKEKQFYKALSKN